MIKEVGDKMTAQPESVVSMSARAAFGGRT